MKNLSLKGKILLLSGFMTFVAATIGTVSYIFSKKTIYTFTVVVKEDVPGIRAINSMLLAMRRARIQLLQLAIPGATKEEEQASVSTLNQEWENFDKENKAYLDAAVTTDGNEKKTYGEFIKIVNDMREDFKKALVLFQKNPDEKSKEREQITVIASKNLREHAKNLEAQTKALITIQAEKIDSDSKIAFEAASKGNVVNILITLIGSLLGFAFAFLFSTKLSKNIGSIISVISSSSDQVASASTQIASSSEELSQATTEQAASLEETAASLEEISAMISKASESAGTTETSSTESQHKAEEGRKSVEQMMHSMEEISRSNDEIMTQVNHSNTQMSEIVRVIQEIGSKTKVINEIVFQTKLLSFNASVEAARAGEHGKGFAVVAEEVGNLAQMSGNAAKEISEMLDSSISKVESIVRESKTKVETLVSTGKQKVESGVETARQCSSVLDEIVGNVTKVTGLAQEISQASKEQAQGVGEINKAMSQLDTVTQQNSATSQQTASSAEQLSAQAVSLKSAIGELVTAVQGGGSKSTPETHKPKPNKKFVASAHTAKVVPFKTKKVAPVREVASYKAVSGDSTPSRDSDGFSEE